MSYSLNFLKGLIGDYIGNDYGVIKRDSRSLDNGSYESLFLSCVGSAALGLGAWLLGAYTSGD